MENNEAMKPENKKPMNEEKKVSIVNLKRYEEIQEKVEQMNAEKAAEIIREVGLPFDEAEAIAQKYKQ